MAAPRVMFVSHTGQMAGAELVLLDVVKPWAGATAFLFEDGPLHQPLTQSGLRVRASRWGRGLTTLQRDGSLAKALPLGGRLVALVAELARTARRHDVIYANSQKAFVLSAIATALARRPLVWHLHDIINDAHFGSGQRKLQVTLANARASRVIVPSQAAAEAFVAEGGKQSLVEVVANGLDIAPNAASPAMLRQQLGLPHGPLVGVFSRLAAWKGQHVVLQAIASTPGVTCVIAGDALFGEQAYATRLRQLADDLGIADRVHFLGHRSDVATLMRAVDIVIHPSVDPEPFGRTLVEAMLTGTPVIATDAGAASEILDGGKAGTLIPPGDAPALAEAIATVLANPDTVVARCDYAIRRAREHYNTATMQASINGVIARAANGRAS